MTPDRSYEIMQFQKIFGERIKSHRRNLRFTQVELANRIGVSRASFANIEAGLQRTSSFLLVQIAEVLKVAPTDLLPSLSDVQIRISQNQRPPVLAEGELIVKELENLNIPVARDSGLKQALEEIKSPPKNKK